MTNDTSDWSIRYALLFAVLGLVTAGLAFGLDHVIQRNSGTMIPMAIGGVLAMAGLSVGLVVNLYRILRRRPSHH